MDRTLRSGLRDQLDALEVRGRRHLDREARRAAFAVAADWAARATVAAGLAALAYAAIAGGVTVPLAIFVVLPPIVLLGAFLAIRRRRVARATALALFDRTLGLKDRAIIADEFGRSSSRDGFREAALDEARPWIDRALSTPVDGGSDTRHAAHRRWPWVVAGCAILALALAVPHRVPGERMRAGSAGRPASPAPSFPRRFADAIEAIVRDDPRAANAARDGVAAPGLRAGAATAGEAGTTSRPVPGGAGGREAGSGERGLGPGRAGAQAAGAAAAAAVSRTGSKASDTKGAQATGDIAAHGDRGGTTPAMDASAPAGSDGGRAMQARDTAGPKTEPAGTPSPPRGGTPPPPRNASPNDGARPNSRRPQQSGQQSGQGDSRSGSRNGGSGAGRASGTDAAKKARGVAAILLATPMEDRFIGTAGAGRASSREQPSPPRAAASDIVRASANGTQTGDAGALLHRPATTHDDRLLATFFRRTGEGGSK